MAEHEKGWVGPDNVPITVGTVKVEDPKEMIVDGRTFDNNVIPKQDFKAERKILTGNTQRRTVADKCKNLAQNLAQNLEDRCKHMEKRLNKLMQ